jgi:hypothetical protein
VTRLDTASGEVQHDSPALLPDGRHFLYLSIGSRTGGVLDPRGVYLGSLDGLRTGAIAGGGCVAGPLRGRSSAVRAERDVDGAAVRRKESVARRRAVPAGRRRQAVYRGRQRCDRGFQRVGRQRRAGLSVGGQNGIAPRPVRSQRQTGGRAGGSGGLRRGGAVARRQAARGEPDRSRAFHAGPLGLRRGGGPRPAPHLRRGRGVCARVVARRRPAACSAR